MVEETETIMPSNTEPASEQQETPVTDTPAVTESQPEQKERTYTKQEVIEMMRRRVERSHNAFFKRYGVKDLNEMDSTFAKIAEYEKQIADLGVMNSGLVKDNAYLKHNINPDRYGDIEAYFKGKDIKINSDTLAQEITTHPEWLKVVAQPAPQTTIKTLSPERSHTIVESEEAKKDRIFGKI